MKRVYLRTLLFTAGAVLTPAAIYAASFQGPGSGCTPPNCNVPGVIWNMQGTGQIQPGARIDIDGEANFGSSAVRNDVLGDIGLEHTKAFYVNQNGTASFSMGNWYGGVARSLNFFVNGDIYAPGVSPFSGAGAEGRVQARKFCFYPGTNPTDCLTTWNSGLHVLKAGDTMTGALAITSSNASPAVSGTGSSGGGGYFTNTNASPAPIARIASGFYAMDLTGPSRITHSGAPTSYYGLTFANTPKAIDTGGGKIVAGVVESERLDATGSGFLSDNASLSAYGNILGAHAQSGLTGATAGTALYARAGNVTMTHTAGGIGVLAEGHGSGARGIHARAEFDPSGIGGLFEATSYAVQGRNGTYGGYFTGSTMGLRAGDDDGTGYGYVGYGDWSFYGPQNAYFGGSVGINTTAITGFTLNVSGSAAKTGGGSWSVFSDERLKDISGNFNAGLDDIMKLDPIRYHYKKDNAKDLGSEEEYIGLSAQQVEKVIPEAVDTVEGYKVLNNDPIIWAMLNSIKQLKVENEELKDRLDKLE